MFIKYNFIYPEVIHIPDNCIWKIYLLPEGESGYNDCSLYLTVEYDSDKIKKYQLAESYEFCQGRDIPVSAVEDLYQDVIETIAKKIGENSNLHFIDIPEIESELLCQKHEKEWIERGYITPDENGSW